jgi:hypothetical protein
MSSNISQAPQGPVPARLTNFTATNTTPQTASSSRNTESRLYELSKPFLDNDPNTISWSRVDLVRGISSSSERPTAMIILNQPITRIDIFLRAWSACT